MFRFYPLIIILQGFCIYHAYKNNNLQRWFFIIFFLPFIGSLIYLYVHFYSRDNIENLSEGVKSVLNTNYQIEKLEKKLKIADTTTNRIRLADEYVKVGRVEEAVDLYKTSMTGISADDPELLMKLIKSGYLTKDYKTVVACGEKLKTDFAFKNSEERIAFAWSLYHLGRKEEAGVHFQDMDARFANHKHRLEYSKFMLETERSSEAKDLLGELLEEFNQMDGREKSLKKPIMREVKKLYQQ